MLCKLKAYFYKKIYGATINAGNEADKGLCESGIKCAAAGAKENIKKYQQIIRSATLMAGFPL